MMGAGDAYAAAWPAALARPAAALSDVLAGFAHTETLSPGACAAGQALQLARLLAWARAQVPYYQDSSWAAEASDKIARGSGDFWDLWRGLPLLSKPTLRAEGARLNAARVPESECPLGLTRTSGSTGIPVEVSTTARTRLIWDALTIREHLWRGRDFASRLGAIRYLAEPARNPAGIMGANWGPPVAGYTRTGPASAIHVGLTAEHWLRWLANFNPHQLLTYPSVAEALLDAGDKPPALTEVRLFSEPVSAALEQRLTKEWGVTVAETYSANETGYIALRCVYGGLHVQSESVLVEILDDNGRPCAEGQSGRVVVTPLHNLATPLIRYDIGDYATVGGDCPCGRKLPVIREVLGRVRNLATAPDGGRFWPVELARIRKVQAVRQFQYVQTAQDKITLRLVLGQALTEDEREEIARLARVSLGHPFVIEIQSVASIERGPTGKFEEFLSLLEAKPWTRG